MTKQELFAEPLFLSLTEQQQNYIRALVENGNNRVEAAKSAYTCNNLETAKATSRRAHNHPVIRRLVDKYFNIKPADRLPTREEFAARMWERGEAQPDAAAAFKYYQLYADVQGFKDTPAPAAPVEQSVAPVDDELMAELDARGLTNGPSSAADLPVGG
jgi:hypothetical protein